MREIRNSVFFFLALALVTGVAYPAAVTVLSQLIFPEQANGSLIYGGAGAPVGSSLIGQPFSNARYFWPRPSATADFPYNALASGGSNLGPTNKELLGQVAARRETLRGYGIQGIVPADLVMASASGLDPHISPEAALLQVPRISGERKLSEKKVRSLVLKHIEDSQLGFLGAPRVNVLKLNLALDSGENRD
ncbi:MAG: potassium-transporting ATPase subunit KdpC [Nitrospirae bacterium]|nr:potassium-transporting ATPase subunit KdpC [Nitrospirota bacterium]